MKKSKFIKYFILPLILIIILIQFIPVMRNNPTVEGHPDWNSPKTEELAKRACFNCHSNETVWPWYSHVAPASWFVSGHVKEGREHFNMSVPPFDNGDHAAKMTEKGYMPLKSYLWMHPEAKLTNKEKEELVQGFQETFGSKKDH